MKKIHLLTLICPIILMSISSFTYATNKAGIGTLTLGSGYYFFASKRHIENVSIPFVALGYNFTPEWAIEGYLGFFTTNFKQNMPEDRQIRGDLFAVDAIYRFFPCSNIQPYLIAGVGILGMNPNGNDAHDEGNINAGIGIQLFPDPLVALRIEARDFYTMVGGKNDIYLNAGVTFMLDFC